MKTHKFFLLVFIFLSLPASALASSLQITEVMYDPPTGGGEPWIEVYNSGSSAVSMTAGTKGWRVADGASAGSISKHLLVDPAATSNGGGRGSLSIPAGGFVVFASDPASFIATYGGSYSVIKSAIAPKTAGGIVQVLDESGAVQDSVSYTGGKGAPGYNDGKSLQRSGDSFVAGTPDPGALSVPSAPVDSSAGATTQGNTNAGATATESTSTTDTAGATDTASVVSDTATPSTLSTQSGSSAINAPPLVAHIVATSPVVVGAGSVFSGSASTQKGAAVANARYVWNFGDGVTSEGQKVLHTYMYPGNYALSLTVSSGYSMGTGYTTLQATPAQITLQSQPDGSVVLANLATQNVAVSFWSLGAAAGQFIIPENTLVLGKQSIRLAPAVMHFSADASTSLFYPNGVRAATSGAPAPAVPITTAATTVALPTSPVPPAGKTAHSVVPASASIAPTTALPSAPDAAPTQSDLSAAVGDAVPADASPVLWESLVGLCALVVLGVAGAWYAKSPAGLSANTLLQHKSMKDALEADDFSILDE